MESRYLILILLFCIGCPDEPIEYDYREPYLGEFNFTTTRKAIGMCYNNSDTCIDGWTYRIMYIKNLTSCIEPLDSNRLTIKFGDDIIGIDDHRDTVSQTITPILLPEGVLSLPEYPPGAGYFTGNYVGYDTILLDIQFGYGIGGYTRYEVTGIRNK
ncbi:MAG: hypothetical protein JW798_17585 [Prolixibacteraceae bacterium]|nr:hypothetical protein [Prolixibacteraceae bacterium]